MEIESDFGKAFINDISKIYMVEFDSGRYNTDTHYVILTWLTKKYDYDQSYYDFKEKTLYFKSKNKAIKVYNDIVSLLKC